MTDAAFGPGLPLPSAEAARQVIPHAALDEARRRAMEALEGGAPVVAVVGAAGNGKTLLLGELAETLKARHPAVHLFRTTHDLLTYRPERSEGGGDDAILLLDEADRATDAQLASLLGTNRAGKVPPRILAGLPSLLRRLEALGRPAAAVTLGPVSRAELPGFIAARLDLAGYPRDLFTAEAVEELARRSGGVPRLVNVLTAAAAFAASLDGEHEVTARHVVEATRHAAGSAQIVHPSPAPKVFVEPSAPDQPGSPGRPHLVDAAARWVDTLGPAPAPRADEASEREESRTSTAAPEEERRAEETAQAALPATESTGVVDDIAIPPQPPLEAEAPAFQVSEPAPPRPADEHLPSREDRPGEEGRGESDRARTATAGVPEEAQFARAPVIAPEAPVALKPAAPLPAGPVAAPPPMPAAGLAREPAAVIAPAARSAVAAPVQEEPAQHAPPARRGYGWAYAAVALLILGGAALALERSKDAPASSPLARLAPLRTWLVERAGLSPPVTVAETSTPAAPDTPRPVPPTPPAAAAIAPPASPPPLPVPARTDQAGPAPATSVPAVTPSQPPVIAAAPAAAPRSLPGTATGPGEAVREPPPAVAPSPVPNETPAPALASRPAAEPPAAAPPPPPAPVVAVTPPSPPARVIVRTLSQAAQDGSERPVAELAARFPDLVTRRGGRGPSFPIVRHFFPADAGNAEAIAGVLSAAGIAARVQDFSGYRPQPRPGTIEVWLP